MVSYFDQFSVITMFMGVTNSSLMLLMGTISGVILFNNNAVMPKSWQVVVELVYSHWATLVKDSLGSSGLKYFPLLFSLFMLLVLLNVLGLFPYVFTVNTHMVMTFSLSLSMLIVVTVLGIFNFNFNFFSMLMPQGAPMVMAPLLVLMETASYLSSAMSLGVSLAANLSAGHLLFAILASFTYKMLTGNLMLLSLCPLGIMMFITMLEIAVAMIQAYVFCLLTTMYLQDTLNLH